VVIVHRFDCTYVDEIIRITKKKEHSADNTCINLICNLKKLSFVPTLSLNLIKANLSKEIFVFKFKCNIIFSTIIRDMLEFTS